MKRRNLSYLLYLALLTMMAGGCTVLKTDLADPAKTSSQQTAQDESSPKLDPGGQIVENADAIRAQGAAAAAGDSTQKQVKDPAVSRDEGQGKSAGEIGPAGRQDENSAKTTPDNEIDPFRDQKIQTDLDEALELCQISQDFWQKGELEKALEALDRAYALILNVNINDQPKLIQQKEDLRFTISKRILEIYASRNIVINGNHKAIPIVVNRHVQLEINRFTSGAERQFFIAAYRRSGRYRARIVSALQEAGLPLELSWLPLIESGYKVKALSRSRALGNSSPPRGINSISTATNSSMSAWTRKNQPGLPSSILKSCTGFSATGQRCWRLTIAAKAEC